MKKTFTLSRRPPVYQLALGLLALSLGTGLTHASERQHSPKADTTPAPKLVIMLVVDGLPQEQILRYRDQFGEGGFKRLMRQGAWYNNAHQAHGVTVTAVGHAAVLTGAYPYQHGIIANNWIDPRTLAPVYCTEDTRYSYLGEDTKADDGTSPANLKVSTVGDELRYATGNQAKVITVSGKDRGAILLAGKAGTAYMMMKKTGHFASSTYYMQSYPSWHQRYSAAKPQDQFYGQRWNLLLKESAYANDAPDALVIADGDQASSHFPFIYTSPSGQPDAAYYESLFTGPFVDEMTLDFALAAVDGETLGHNPAGVTDLLGISLSSHDYVNHAWGPESRMSHDHLQRLDRMLAKFFTKIDQKIGLDNTLILLTADHGFPNVPEFSHSIKRDAQRIDSKALMNNLNQALFDKFGLEKLAKKWSTPSILIDYKLAETKGITAVDIENTIAKLLLATPGIANVYTRTQLENGLIPDSRISKLMQRAWHRQISGDILVVTQPYSYFGKDKSGTSHGSPYSYDTNVPLMIMGSRWIKPGAMTKYAEVVDIAATLAHLLRVRPPSGSEGRILGEVIR